MATMTKRERVERALNLQETDRVPLYDLLLCDKAIEHFSGETLPPLVEDAQTRATVERMTGTAISRMLDATRSYSFGPLADADVTDGDGFVVHVDAREKTSWIVTRPFDDVAGAAEYVKRQTAGLETQAALGCLDVLLQRQRRQTFRKFAQAFAD